MRFRLSYSAGHQIVIDDPAVTDLEILSSLKPEGGGINLDAPISALNLPVKAHQTRIENICRGKGIRSIRDLLQIPVEDLQNWRGMGLTLLLALQGALAVHGLILGSSGEHIRHKSAPELFDDPEEQGLSPEDCAEEETIADELYGSPGDIRKEVQP
jgi:hypothetical protein